jgi:hypothetical protein
MVRGAEHRSSTHALNEFWILTNKCGNKLKHENEAKRLIISVKVIRVTITLVRITVRG